MNHILLGYVSTFLGGAALALLASYPIEGESAYACFWALFLALASCITAGWAIAIHASRKNSVPIEHVIELAVDAVERHMDMRSGPRR